MCGKVTPSLECSIFKRYIDKQIGFLAKVIVDQKSTVSPVSMLTSLLHMRQPSEDPNDIENVSVPPAIYYRT